MGGTFTGILILFFSLLILSHLIAYHSLFKPTSKSPFPSPSDSILKRIYQWISFHFSKVSKLFQSNSSPSLLTNSTPSFNVNSKSIPSGEPNQGFNEYSGSNSYLTILKRFSSRCKIQVLGDKVMIIRRKPFFFFFSSPEGKVSLLRIPVLNFPLFNSYLDYD